VDGVPPFSPGLVYSHLRLQDPGSKIGIESPDYRRAVAEKRQAETNARAAQAQAAAAEASAKSARAKEIEQQSRDALEETYGPTLDALSREDLYELAATVGARRGWGIAFLIERATGRTSSARAPRTAFDPPFGSTPNTEREGRATRDRKSQNPNRPQRSGFR
jgi:hypothetical protein